MPDLARQRQMVGSIDPRRKTLRAIQWRNDVAQLCGTSAAETILASGHLTPHSTGRTYGCKRSDPNSASVLRAGGRPHMDCFVASLLAMTCVIRMHRGRYWEFFRCEMGY